MGFHSAKSHHHDTIEILAIVVEQIVKEPPGNLW